MKYKLKFIKKYRVLDWDADTEIQVHHGQERNDSCFRDLNTALKGKSLLIYTSVLAEGISVDTIPVQRIFMDIRFCRRQGGIVARTLAQMSMRCARSDKMLMNQDVLVLMESKKGQPRDQQYYIDKLKSAPTEDAQLYKVGQAGH